MPAPKIQLIDGVYDLRRTFNTVLPHYFFNRIIYGRIRESIKPEGGFYVDVSTTSGEISSKRYANHGTASRLLGAVIKEVRRRHVAQKFEN